MKKWTDGRTGGRAGGWMDGWMGDKRDWGNERMRLSEGMGGQLRVGWIYACQWWVTQELFAGAHLCNVHKFVHPSIRHIILCLQIFKQIFRNKLIYNCNMFTLFYLLPISVILKTLKSILIKTIINFYCVVVMKI